MVPGPSTDRNRNRPFPVAFLPCFSSAFALLLAGFGLAFSLVFRCNSLIYNEIENFSEIASGDRGFVGFVAIAGGWA